MAQITIKGYIAGDITVNKVGKNNIEKARALIFDDTRQKHVGFQVDFWRDMVKEIQKFRKGSKVMVKATVEDGTYEKDVNGQKTKIYALNYNAIEIVAVVDGVEEDLDKQMERYRQAQNQYPGMTPVDEQMPDFAETDKK
ncbi:MAG: hypothetical protein K2L70_04485 [Clostridia bacterium]|nr:hypothetical protein [Clostridia bacterium]